MTSLQKETIVSQTSLPSTIALTTVGSERFPSNLSARTRRCCVRARHSSSVYYAASRSHPSQWWHFIVDSFFFFFDTLAEISVSGEHQSEHESVVPFIHPLQQDWADSPDNSKTTPCISRKYHESQVSHTIPYCTIPYHTIPGILISMWTLLTLMWDCGSRRRGQEP